MQKLKTCLKNYLKNKKAVILTLVVLAAFCICVVLNYHRAEAVTYTTWYTIDAGEVTANVTDGGVIEQEVVLKEGDTGIGVKFATYTSEITEGTIGVDVCDEDGNVVINFAIPATEIVDNGFCAFEFGDIPQELVGKKCIVRLMFVGIDEGVTIGVYASKSDTQDWACRVNGVEQDNDMVIKGVQKISYWTYRDCRLFYIFAVVVLLCYHIYKYTLEDVKTFFKNIYKNKKIIAIVGITLLLARAAAYGAEYYLEQQRGGWNLYREYMFFAIFGIISFTIVFWKYILKKAHVYFWIVAMLVGSFVIMTIPPANISWDEHIHSFRTAYMSWGAQEKVSEAEYALYSDETLFNPTIKTNRELTIEKFNSLSNEKEVEIYDWIGISAIAYTPGAIAMFIGRELLKLEFYSVYLLGKMANLTCYATFIAMAIKKLQGRGKLVAAALGLIPTCIFQVVTYSYDWWVYSLGILGFAMFIGEVQKNGAIKNSRILLSVGTMVLAFLPKAVYFPLMFPLMTLKKDKYKNSKSGRLIVFLGMIVLLLSFVLPLFVGSGAGLEDERGGTDVNSAGQIVFILTNFFDYLRILFEFFWAYFEPDGAYRYLISFSYVGKSQSASLCMIAIAIAAVIDNTDKLVFRDRAPWLRFANFLGVFGAMTLVATAMYVAYTPVGYEGIMGCQYRYFLPALFPLMFFMGENKIKIDDDLKRKGLVFVCFAMLYVLISGWYDLIVSSYFI